MPCASLCRTSVSDKTMEFFLPGTYIVLHIYQMQRNFYENTEVIKNKSVTGALCEVLALYFVLQ